MVGSTLVAIIFGAFGLFGSWWALLLPLVGFLTAYMMASLAVTAASASPMLETLGYWVSFGIFPMYWLSGTFYRPDDLDGWVYTLQLLWPAYHAVALARDVCGTEGATIGISTLINAAVLIGIGVVFTWSAVVLMRRRLIR
jgi:ABC-type polysaccharide/polyol phosphate export permease